MKGIHKQHASILLGILEQLRGGRGGQHVRSVQEDKKSECVHLLTMNIPVVCTDHGCTNHSCVWLIE